VAEIDVSSGADPSTIPAQPHGDDNGIINDGVQLTGRLFNGRCDGRRRTIALIGRWFARATRKGYQRDTAYRFGVRGGLAIGILFLGANSAKLT
jgi:hypothetical protein